MATASVQHLRQTLLGPGFAALIGLIWTYWYLTQWFGWHATAHTVTVSVYYAAGLALGLFGVTLADRWFLSKLTNLTVRRCLWIALAFVFVCTFTATLLAIQYRIYYAQWHEPFLSRDWIIQLVFTGLGAVAQYGIFGIRYHGPGAVLIILATCWWATRTKH